MEYVRLLTCMFIAIPINYIILKYLTTNNYLQTTGQFIICSILDIFIISQLSKYVFTSNKNMKYKK